MKKFLSLVAFILVLVVCHTSAFAKENKKDTEDTKQTINLTINLQPSNETKEDDDQSNIRIKRSTSSNKLDSWDCDISKIKSGYIKGSSSTSSVVIADEMGCTIFFQMYNNGKWTTIKSSSFKEYDTDYIKKNCNITVNKGKKYRVIVDHYAIYNGHKETARSTSSIIYVD